jgi:hypothetical protein
MGLLDSRRGRDADDEPSAETESETETNAAGSDGGGRRWLVAAVGGLIAVGAILYLRSRRRAAREAEFTEIELEPTESESESASTE